MISTAPIVNAKTRDPLEPRPWDPPSLTAEDLSDVETLARTLVGLSVAVVTDDGGFAFGVVTAVFLAVCAGCPVAMGLTIRVA